jgi:putative serine/threonine protein kinase
LDKFVHREKASLDEVLHPLDPSDDYTRFVLCFPYRDCKQLADRVELLVRASFNYLIEYGVDVLGYRVVGKGYSSINVLAYHDHYGRGLLKIRRLDSRRPTLEYEGLINDYLDITGYTPKLYMWSREYIFREYLDKCTGIEQAIKNYYAESMFDQVIYIIKKTLYALYLFDKLGVDHGELNRPYNHIFWCPGNGVKVIDWESSRFGRKTHNLSSFISFLLYRFKLRGFNELIDKVKNDILVLTRRYKKYRSITIVRDIVRLLEKQLYRY